MVVELKKTKVGHFRPHGVAGEALIALLKVAIHNRVATGLTSIHCGCSSAFIHKQTSEMQKVSTTPCENTAKGPKKSDQEEAKRACARGDMFAVKTTDHDI